MPMCPFPPEFQEKVIIHSNAFSYISSWFLYMNNLVVFVSFNFF